MGDPKLLSMKDLSGFENQRVKIISFAGYSDEHGYRMWKCECLVCGNLFDGRGSQVVRGLIRSCGCKHFKHGMINTPIYFAYRNMLDRCYNPEAINYHKYGAKGVTVCDEWRESFYNFWCDMGNMPEGKSLDRKDNSKGYSLENCKWSTRSEQNLNRSNVKKSQISKVLIDCE